MRIAVVGAGLAGLAAARALAEAGSEVVVFEKSRGLGGRLASRRVGDLVLDHGAPAIDAPAGSSLAKILAELPAGAVQPVAGAVEGPRDPWSPLGPRPVVFAVGLTYLAKCLARDLEIVRGVRIAALRTGSTGIEIGDEQGNAHGTVDAVVIAAPAPQAADLLERSPEPRRAAPLRAVDYEPAVMALLGARRMATPDWFLRRAASGPLAYVAVETAKGRAFPGEGVALVARLSPDQSAAFLDAACDEEVLAMALPAIADLVGHAVEPTLTQVKRWRYAVPTARLAFEDVNPAGSRIVICGDAVSAPGMAAVYESGLRAAAALTGA